MERLNYLVKEVDFTITVMDRVSASRDVVWKMALEKAKRMFKNNNNSDRGATKEAMKSISSLLDLATSTQHSTKARSAFRYFGQEKVRSVITHAYEHKLPFKWLCNWSSTTMQERVLQLNEMMGPILMKRKSRLLGNMPIMVVACIMDYICNKNAVDPEWWNDIDHMNRVLSKSVLWMQNGSKQSVNEEDNKKITASVEVFANAVVMLNDKYTKFKLHDLKRLEEDFEPTLLSRVEMNRDKNEEGKYVYIRDNIAAFFLKKIRILSPVLAAEYSLSVSLQKTSLRFANEDKDKKYVEHICKYLPKKNANGEMTVAMCLDNMFLDAVYMLSDICKVISNLTDASNSNVIGHIMNVMYEPWEQTKRINFKKLFLLALAFVEGVHEENIDCSVLAEGILSRIGEDGTFLEKFPKGMKNKRVGDGLQKRAPNRQPVVFIFPGSDSEEEIGDNRKRRRTQGGKSPVQPFRKKGKHVAFAIPPSPVSGDNVPEDEDHDGKDGYVELEKMGEAADERTSPRGGKMRTTQSKRRTGAGAGPAAQEEDKEDRAMDGEFGDESVLETLREGGGAGDACGMEEELEAPLGGEEDGAGQVENTKADSGKASVTPSVTPGGGRKEGNERKIHSSQESECSLDNMLGATQIPEKCVEKATLGVIHKLGGKPSSGSGRPSAAKPLTGSNPAEGGGGVGKESLKPSSKKGKTRGRGGRGGSRSSTRSTRGRRRGMG